MKSKKIIVTEKQGEDIIQYMIKESLITYDYEKIKNFLYKNYPNQIRLNISNENDNFKLWVEMDINIAETVLQYLISYGYYPFKGKENAIDSITQAKRKNENKVGIPFLKNYDKNYDDTPNQFYHITPLLSANKIIKNGLSPRSLAKTESHPDRVYLVSDDSRNELIYMVPMFFQQNKNEFKYKEWYALLKITFPENHKPKIYNDPQSNGYYVIENIPPNYIEIVEKYRLNNNGEIIETTP
jgi:hypothetical protein